MDIVALESAFGMYPAVKLVISAELYGFLRRMDEIKRICEKHGALLIEDAAEVMRVTIDVNQCICNQCIECMKLLIEMAHFIAKLMTISLVVLKMLITEVCVVITII